MFSTYLAAIAIMLALGALFVAAQAVRYAKSCTEWISENNKRSVSLKRIMEVEAVLTDHEDSIEAVRKSMHKLRSRIHMRNVNREKQNGVPDPDQDPKAWKAYMNAQLLK